MTIKRILSLLATTALASTAFVGVSAHAEASCGDANHPGGDWRQINGPITGTREQAAETTIDATNAGSLEKKWDFSVLSEEGVGNFQSSATIADGCVFIGTTNGWVYALNADTGETVWKTLTGGGPPGGHFALSVVDGRVHANISAPNALRSITLDASDGSELWLTDVLADDIRQGTVINSSPVVYDGMVWVTLSVATGPGTRVPYYVFDAETGDVLHKGFVIPDDDLEHGYGGGGIWSRAAVDEATGYLYVGTSDSETYDKQHAYNSAIIKVDLARQRDELGNKLTGQAITNPRFGTVVDAYKGMVDTIVPGVERQEACKQYGNNPANPFNGEHSPVPCGEHDIDFGASVNLFTDEEGDLVVSAMQKACVFHVVHADTMAQKWTSIHSRPAALGCAATAAVGDDQIFVSADPGNIWAMSSIGFIDWVMPTASATRYQPMSYANGVAYTVDNAGVLWGWDAATGAPVLTRAMATDVGDACATLSGGVSIARNRVYAVCDIGIDGGGWLVSYGLPS